MKDILFTVLDNKPIYDGVFELILKSEEKLPPIQCGQFIHLEVKNSDSTLLRRPFCLCKYGDYTITLLIAVAGKGTDALQKVKTGETLLGIMPIGNGFFLDESQKRVVIVGGGIGAAPLLAINKNYPNKEYFTYLGYPTKNSVYLDKDFKEFSTELTVCTDDGTFGKRGYPTDYLEEEIGRINPDVIITCGAEGMLKAVARISAKRKIPAYMTGESRMGCGVGACLVCTCKIKGKDGEIHNKRACVDGPVFNLEDVIL